MPSLRSGTLLAQAQPADIFGTVSPPPGVDRYNALAGGPDKIGLIIFISNLIKIATVVAGVWVLVNFLLAGFEYITAAGDSGAYKRVNERFTMSVIGLVVIVAAYSLAGLTSLLIFGRADFILNPTITGPGDIVP